MLFAPIVMVTDPTNQSSIPLVRHDLSELGSEIMIRILPKNAIWGCDGFGDRGVFELQLKTNLSWSLRLYKGHQVTWRIIYHCTEYFMY